MEKKIEDQQIDSRNLQRVKSGEESPDVRAPIRPQASRDLSLTKSELLYKPVAMPFSQSEPLAKPVAPAGGQKWRGGGRRARPHPL